MQLGFLIPVRESGVSYNYTFFTLKKTRNNCTGIRVVLRTWIFGPVSVFPVAGHALKPFVWYRRRQTDRHNR